MKNLVIILGVILIPVFSYSQTPDTCFTSQQLINIAENINAIQQENSDLRSINGALNHQLDIFEDLHEQDINYIDLQKRQIQLMNDQLETQTKYIRKTKKWYNSPIFFSIVGAGTAILVGKTL